MIPEYRLRLRLLRSLVGYHLARAQRLPLLVQCRIPSGPLADPSYLWLGIGEPGLVLVSPAHWTSVYPMTRYHSFTWKRRTSDAGTEAMPENCAMKRVFSTTFIHLR